MATSLLLSATHSLPPPAQHTTGDDGYVDPDTLRTTFALAMSAMYSAEVPLYSDLIRIVEAVNRQVLESQQQQQQHQEEVALLPSSSSSPNNNNKPPSPPTSHPPVHHHDSVERLTLERHGAIRLGTPQELHTARRLFALMGMHPVNYYDLAVAGLPMHATCFRPTTAAALAINPFRVFTTLLRPTLLADPSARALALRLLARRRIFSPALLALLDAAEQQQQQQQPRVTRAQAPVLVAEALRSFGWQPVAAATAAEYAALRAEHAILADVACFRAAHINHLTPRALDIDAAHARMVREGLRVKARIEGPPRRRCGVLLRQTSFLALEEGIQFLAAGGEGEGEGGGPANGGAGLVAGQHKARFGEIEERGAAVTAKGRKLYDELLAASRAAGPVAAGTADEAAAREREREQAFAEAFARAFPDSWDELRRARLIYCEYTTCEGAQARLAAGSSSSSSPLVLDELVCRGVLRARPLTYEDFLPFSAAGIFQSNLQQQPPPPPQSLAARRGEAEEKEEEGGDREGYERAMGCAVLDSDQLYAEAQRRSLERCAVELGLDVGVVADLVA